MSFLETIGTAAQALWVPVLVTAILVVTVGLVSIWAALSRRHWFLRAVGVAAVIAPTAAIPGHDVVLVFLLQSLFVIGGIKVFPVVRAAIQNARATHDSETADEAEAGHPSRSGRTRRGYPRFSLMDLMLVVLVASAIFSVLVQTPRHVWAEWEAILVVGASFGSLALPAAHLACIFFYPQRPNWLVGKPIRGRRDLVLRVSGLVLMLLLWSMFLLPFAVVYHKAINPIPVPAISLPNPNGYDDLVRVGETLPDMGMPDPNAATSKGLADFVRGNPEVYDVIRLGLSRESLVPVTYTNGVLNTSASKALRDVADALIVEGRLAEAEGRIPDAVTSYLDILRLAEASSRGGLATDVFVGGAQEWVAVDQLARIVGILPVNEAERTTEALQTLDRRREPLEAIVTRERLWANHAYGKMGRALDAMNMSLFTVDSTEEAIFQSRLRQQARVRLLICELAIHCYRLDHDRLPDKLADLVPRYLDAVPTDPYNGKPIIFRPVSAGPILYSVGPDRRDDSGKPLDRKSSAPIWPGDVLLREPEDSVEETLSQ